MIVYSFIAVTLFLSIWSLIILWRAHTRAWRYNWHRLLLGITIALFVYLYGGWSFISIYARYLFAIAIPAVFLIGLRRKKILTNDYPAWKKTSNILGALIFFTLSVLYYTGTTGKVKTVSLHFPFRKGRYIVQQGGKGLPANIFHVSSRNAIYAVDLAKLNAWGNRAEKLFSHNLSDYNIYGDTVLSPCAGKVVRIINDNPDNIPPLRLRGPHNLNGVLIETDSLYIFLGHMKYHSILVAVGDEVIAGQPLGQVGNSGMSLEPHLHIQAHLKVNDGAWYTQPPVFILFDGKEYLLSDVITR